MSLHVTFNIPHYPLCDSCYEHAVNVRVKKWQRLHNHHRMRMIKGIDSKFAFNQARWLHIVSTMRIKMGKVNTWFPRERYYLGEIPSQAIGFSYNGKTMKDVDKLWRR